MGSARVNCLRCHIALCACLAQLFLNVAAAAASVCSYERDVQEPHATAQFAYMRLPAIPHRKTPCSRQDGMQAT